MKMYQFFHQDTGTFADLIITATDERSLPDNVPADHVAFNHPNNAAVDHLSQKIDVSQLKLARDAHLAAHTARVLELHGQHMTSPPIVGHAFTAPPIPLFVFKDHTALIDYLPLQLSPDHEWNTATKRWVLGAVAQAKIEAIRAAAVRRIELVTEQHDWTRRLALDPESKTARAALELIDDELKTLDGGVS